MLVRVYSTSGEEGWGEADPTPSPRYSQASKLNEIVEQLLMLAIIGSEIEYFAMFHRTMDSAVAAYRATKAAVDGACYDLIGE